MIEFKLNGTNVSSTAAEDTPLLWVLRDEFGLKGTKFGCGIARCGACTIHVDGKATRSCVLPLASARGAAITTIEGLDPKGQHPLQRAWVEHQVPQCGYCQSGQIMQAAQLLAENAAPDDAQITTHMNGNLCRCMAYTRIRKAIRAAAGQAAGGQDNG